MNLPCSLRMERHAEPAKHLWSGAMRGLRFFVHQNDRGPLNDGGPQNNGVGR